MSAVAVILARAGSKGVPGKNVALVGGRPCIAWTIEAARASRLVRATVVSTDDPQAQAIAREAGVRVVDRPAFLASDSARVDDAVRHAVEATGDVWTEPRSRDAIVILYANVPVRPAGLIDRAVRLFEESGCDSVQSYAPVGKFHPWWMARLSDGGMVKPWEGEVLNHGVYRRQDLPAAWVPDGGVLVVSRAALFGPGAGAGPHAFFGADRRGIETREGDVVDIDSPLDLVVADAILSGRAGGRSGV